MEIDEASGGRFCPTFREDVSRKFSPNVLVLMPSIELYWITGNFQLLTHTAMPNVHIVH